MNCSKTSGFIRFFATLLVATFLWVGSASTAFALNIETSNIDAAMSVEPNTSSYFIKGLKTRDNRDKLAGRNECQKLWNDNTPLVVSFQFNSAVNVDSCSGSSGPCIERIMFFALPTDATPTDFSCTPENSLNCLDTGAADLSVWFKRENKTNQGLDIRVRFPHMVREAVAKLDASNNASIIESADDCVQEGEAAINQQYFIRVFLKNLGTNGDQTGTSDVRIEIDTKRPDGPSEISSIAVTEQNIFASWSQSNITDLKGYRAYWSASDFSDMTMAEIEVSKSIYNFAINLDNPEPLDNQFSGSALLNKIPDTASGKLFVAIASRDNAENISEPTFPGEGLDPEGDGFEILEVIDFWEHYHAAGGSEQGGCSSTGGGLPAGWLFALAGFGLLGFRRQRRRAGPWAAAILVVGAALALAPDAHADSNIYGIAEVRLGFYYPAIDEEAGLSGTPFNDVFGDSHRALGEYEMGVHLYKGFGALGVSGRIGYTSFSGDVLVGETADGAPAPSGSIGEETELMIIPMGVSLYYRLDILEKFWSIPLVPVVKGGLDYAYWSAGSASGQTSNFEGNKGSGGTFGWHVAGALHLWLDWIEPETAAGFDNSWGVNNSYLFAEYSMRQLDDFGSAQSFNLSDDMWVFGIAFEY